MLETLTPWNRWGGAILSGGVERDIITQLQPLLDTDDIIVLKGIRRAGKTTILFQMMDLLEASGVIPKAFLYVNFEEPAFASELGVDLLEKIYRHYREHIFPEGRAYLFFDEIQNVPEWERWVRARNDTENIKIFITGSSSRLMSRELGTLLTGRHLSFQIFPLSFREFLRFEGITIQHQTVSMTVTPKIQNALNKYLKWGGFPEVVLAQDEYRKRLLLRQYFDDILFKDIAMRHHIRDIGTLRNLAVHLLTQTGNLISANRIANLFGVSLDLAKAYCVHIEEAFLGGFIPYYSQKVAERNRHPQKVYAIDLGLRQVVSLAHSEDRGHIIETAVYHMLMRQVHDGIFYWKQEDEIDFMVRQGNTVQTLMQVVDSDVDKVHAIPREINALQLAAKQFPQANKIIIASRAPRDIMFESSQDVTLVPLSHYLLKTYSI